MKIKKIKTKLHNRISDTSLKVGLTALMLFGTYDVALAKKEAPSKNLMIDPSQERVVSR